MGRPKGSKNVRPLIKLPEGHNLKVQLVSHANTLQKMIGLHLAKRYEMTPVDLGIAKLVFAKVLPDMAAIEHTDSTPITLRTIVIDVSGERVDVTPVLPITDESDTTH